jgi:hypothetical protein
MAHPVGPCGMPLKPPDERRLSNLRWSVAGTLLVTYTLILFCGGLSTLGGSDGPEHRGLREANRIVPSLFLGFALAWFVSLFPVLSTETRHEGMRRCRVAICITTVAWFGWVLVRPHL